MRQLLASLCYYFTFQVIDFALAKFDLWIVRTASWSSFELVETKVIYLNFQASFDYPYS